MKTPISYYGGKQNLVSEILPLIPKSDFYCEPFFGGGAVFWTKPKVKHETINDMDDQVINFYRIVQTDFEALEYLVKTTLHNESEHKKTKKILKGLVEADDIVKACAFWVQTNISFSNKIFGGFAYSRINHVSTYTSNKILAFNKDLQSRLGDVEIFCRDALNVIDNKDHKDQFFYVDPPYFNSDCGHYGGYTEEDFKNLLEKLMTIKGKFLLSCYPSELLDNYDFKFKKNIIQPLSVSGKHNTGKTKTEVLAGNYELEQKSLF